MIAQPCFPGFEAFLKPVDLSKGARRLLRILQWFKRKAKEIRVGQKWLADRLGVSLRSVNRWFAELRAAGAEILEWRGPNPPLISVDGVAFGVAFAPLVSITQSEQQKPLPKQNTTNAPSSSEPRAQGRKQLPVGFDEAFSNYIGIFYAAGKAMNVHDVHRAHAAWIGIGPGEWEAATKHALEQCQRTRHAQFVPMPVNHLLDRGWTRVAPPRTLPYVDTTVSRQDANQAEAARRFLAEKRSA